MYATFQYYRSNNNLHSSKQASEETTAAQLEGSYKHQRHFSQSFEGLL